MRVLVHDFLRDMAQRRPDHVALTADGASLTFGALDRASDALACGFHRLGVRRGDRIAVVLENGLDAVIAVFGILKAGGVFVLVNSSTKPDKLHYLLEDCGARVLICAGHLRDATTAATALPCCVREVIGVGFGPESPSGAHRFEELSAGHPGAPRDPQLIDNDLGMIMYTSGSSGPPKGVMLTHRNMTNTAWAISTYLGNVPDDVVLCVLPLSFDYGLYQVITAARVGFRVLLERSFAYPFKTLQLLQEQRVTGLPGVPTVFATLLQMPAFATADLTSLRYLTNTGAAFPPAHIRRLRELCPHARIFSMYGLTECTRVSFLSPEEVDGRITSVGKAMPNAEVYLVDDEDRRLGPSSVGQLVVRGANVMRGYWRKPEATAAVLRDGELAGEKVLYTGDWFRMDEDGYLYFLGRRDDVFKCRGEKVSPKEIENVLYELPDVAEAAVVGVADPIDGHAIKAFVVPRSGTTLAEQEVRRHCRARLESHLVPKFIEVRAALPKTDSGKIRRASLAAEMSGAVVDSTRAPGR